MNNRDFEEVSNEFRTPSDRSNRWRRGSNQSRGSKNEEVDAINKGGNIASVCGKDPPYPPSRMSFPVTPQNKNKKKKKKKREKEKLETEGKNELVQVGNEKNKSDSKPKHVIHSPSKTGKSYDGVVKYTEADCFKISSRPNGASATTRKEAVIGKVVAASGRPETAWRWIKETDTKNCDDLNSSGASWETLDSKLAVATSWRTRA